MHVGSVAYLAGTLKWNKANINVISTVTPSPAVTGQNVQSGKRSICNAEQVGDVLMIYFLAMRNNG